MKRLFPQAHCPDCRGAISYWDVMSIMTPFNCINCVTCGEMVFLKFPWKITWLLVGLGIVISACSLVSMIYEVLSVYQILGIGFGVVIVAEFILTRHLVGKGQLATRKGPTE